MHVETERYTARELGIPMPAPTIKPLFAALAIVIMFSGLFFLERHKLALFFVVTLGGAAMLIGMLYSWLLSPLEEPVETHAVVEHHPVGGR
jgi:hypothetical protein